jgi:hypothetical protein
VRQARMVAAILHRALAAGGVRPAEIRHTHAKD